MRCDSVANFFLLISNISFAMFSVLLLSLPSSILDWEVIFSKRGGARAGGGGGGGLDLSLYFYVLFSS